jgi:hypothetical protein
MGQDLFLGVLVDTTICPFFGETDGAACATEETEERKGRKFSDRRRTTGRSKNGRRCLIDMLKTL